MEQKYILALDQGTSSSRAIVFDHEGRICATAQKEFPQHFPKPGWVEHDPKDIWSSEASVIAEAITSMGINGLNIAGIGITNLSYGMPKLESLSIMQLSGRTEEHLNTATASRSRILPDSSGKRQALSLTHTSARRKSVGFWKMFQVREPGQKPENCVSELSIHGCCGT